MNFLVDENSSGGEYLRSGRGEGDSGVLLIFRRHRSRRDLVVRFFSSFFFFFFSPLFCKFFFRIWMQVGIRLVFVFD